MKEIYKIMIELCTILGIIIIGVTSQYFLGPDNPVEEGSEETVETTLGMEEGTLDWSPGTPERKLPVPINPKNKKHYKEKKKGRKHLQLKGENKD